MTEMLLVVGWLLIALGTRRVIPLLAAVRIPASLIAGAIGLAMLQGLRYLATDLSTSATWSPLGEASAGWGDNLRAWPGVLIAVVFAGLLLAKAGGGRLGVAGAGPANRLRRVGRQGLMVWIIVLGQTTVGMWITWLLIQPSYELPNATGMLIETGFAGGHGTAAAMGTVFAHPSVNLPAGLDLGILMATAGLGFGLVSGIVWINLAIWLRWYQPPADTRSPDSPAPAKLASATDATDATDASGNVQGNAIVGPPLGKPRIEGSNIDPLLFQLLWLLAAFGIGFGLQQLVSWGGVQVDQWRGVAESGGAAAEEAGDAAMRQRLTVAGVLGAFPLFIYTLFGGAIVRWLLQRAGQAQRIDADSIARLVGTAMDLLVVAAVASMNLTAVASMWVPFTCLFLGGAIWSSFCLLFLSRQILPDDVWLPLGLINYGMSTGTTATGFVLLRVVDPHLQSRAGEEYALAAPLSAPFIGGGIVTVALPLLVLQRVPIGWSTLVLTALLLGFIIVGIRSKRVGTGL